MSKWFFHQRPVWRWFRKRRKTLKNSNYSKLLRM